MVMIMMVVVVVVIEGMKEHENITTMGYLQSS